MTVEYLLFTGLVFLVLYVWSRKKYWYAKMQQRYPENKQIVREIKYSVYSLFISGAVILLVTWANTRGWTLVYKKIDQYGYFYFFISPLLMIVIHDAYFYWTHRLMHWKKIFKYVHRTHHLSINPTPFSAQAFHPIEALIQVGIIPLVAFTIPNHVAMITAFILYSTLMNVAGHCGFEFLPKKFIHNKILKWHNTASHHNLHHRFFNNNFGLYFNFWDRVMKTNYAGYEVYFEKLADERAQAKAEPKPPACKTPAAGPVAENIEEGYQ